MPTFLSRGDTIKYITSNGGTQSKVVKTAWVKSRILYLLENGDYV
jgi:hypothetical protein